MIRKNHMTTPEGYFDELQQKLLAIPSGQGSVTARPAPAPRGFRRLAPYFALAASIAIAVIAGNFILRQTTQPAPLEAEAALSLTDDDILNYLIADGTTVEHIEYIRYEEDR